MKLNATYIAGSSDTASGGSQQQAGKASVSFASLLGAKGASEEEASPASTGNRAGAGWDKRPQRKDAKDRDQKNGSHSAEIRPANALSVQRNTIHINCTAPAALATPNRNESAGPSAVTSQSVTVDNADTEVHLDAIPHGATQTGGLQIAGPMNLATAPGQKAVAAIADLIQVDEDGDQPTLLVGNEDTDFVDSSSRVNDASFDKSVAPADKVDTPKSSDISNATAEVDRSKANIKSTMGVPGFAKAETGTLLQCAERISQSSHNSTTIHPQEDSATRRDEAFSASSSSSAERAANSMTAVGSKQVEPGNASTPLPTDANAQSTGVAPAGNSQAADGDQPHRDASGSAANSSDSGETSQHAFADKKALPVGDFTQAVPAQTVSTPMARAGTASVSPSTPVAPQSVLQRIAEARDARDLQNAMRGDLRVGVQTEAFGRVTIQTTAMGGDLSAQLSLENLKQSAALAAHLPGVEQKLTQQYGLNASVSLAGGSGSGTAGGSTSGGGHGSDPGNGYQQNSDNSANTSSMRFGSFSYPSNDIPRADFANPPPVVSSLSARLDVTA